MAPTCGGASSYAQSCAYGNRFNHVTLAHAFALDLTLGVGRFYRVLSRDSGDGGDQRHGSMIGFDLIEAEQHAGMQSLLDGTKVAFDFLTARYGRAIRSNQIFGKLGFEVLALFQFLGVELVLEPDEKSRALRNGARDSGRIPWSLSYQWNANQQEWKTRQPSRPWRGHMETSI